MKTFSILLVCLILGMSLQQAVVIPTCSLTDTAANKNPVVLNWLKSKGVKLNDSPDKTVAADVCNGELTTYGSCCEVTSLRTFIASLNTGLATKWKNYIGRIARIKGKLVSGFNKIASKMNVQDIQNKLNSVKSNPKIANKFANAGAVIPATAEDIAQLKTFFTSFNEYVQTFKTKGKLCFDAMRVARANMFCAACSGRATSLTDVQTSSTASFRIDQNSCNSLVSQCYGIWKFNFFITSMMQYVNVNLAKKKGDSADNAFKTQKVVSATDLEELKVVFRNCAFANTAATTLTCNTIGTIKTAQDLTNTLCTKQFSVNNQNAYLEGDETVDSGVSDDEVQNADADIEAAKRVLQAAESTLDMGVTVETGSNAAYTNMNNATSTVVPVESVNTANAGDSTSSSMLVQTTVAAILAVAYLF